MDLTPTADLRALADAAYDRLGPFYDRYTEHPAYAGWVERLEALARRHGLAGGRALDVGCGTGKSLVPLLGLGYEAVGCEPAPAMLEAARARTERRVPLHRCGLPDVPVLGVFDYVTALNDVLNYLDPWQLAPAFAALADNLRPGGVLLFDTTTLATFRSFFATDHVRRRDDHVFAWSGATPPDLEPGGRAHAWLDVFVPCGDGRHRRLAAEQVQGHHPEEEVAAALLDAGLDLRALLGQPEEGAPEEPLDPGRHLKAIWIARKP